MDHHIITVANETLSGLCPRWWVEKLVEVGQSEGRTHGPAFASPEAARGYLSFFDRLRCFVLEVLACCAGGDRAHTRRPGCGCTLFNVPDAQKEGDHKNRMCGIWKSICRSIEQVKTSGESSRLCSPQSGVEGHVSIRTGCQGSWALRIWMGVFENSMFWKDYCCLNGLAWSQQDVESCITHQHTNWASPMTARFVCWDAFQHSVAFYLSHILKFTRISTRSCSLEIPLWA